MLNKDGEISVEEFVNSVNAKSGKAGGWPNYFNYDINNNRIKISVNSKKLDKKACRRLDPWSLAFLIDAKTNCNVEINAINYSISGSSDEIYPNNRLNPDIEAFRRRVSFLNINNPSLTFEIEINGEALEIYTADKLFNRPDSEKIRESFDRDAQDNRPGRLEKDFQTWLFANETKCDGVNINERLAVLGEDFYKLGNRNLGIIREFPTGVFQNKVSNSTRILPTEFVDIVTLNKHGSLSVIELKLNDSQLEVIAQLMDYALYFRSYINKLMPIITNKLQKKPKEGDIICYVVNNYYHNRFDEVMKFYSTRKGLYGFKIVKIVLGYSMEIAP
jgi:hypothetical protein